MAGIGEEEMEEEGGTKRVEFADPDPQVTEYEKERQETIQRNRDILAKLQVTALATSLELSSQAKSKKDLKFESVGGVKRRSERLSSVKENSSSASKAAAAAAEWSSSEEEGTGSEEEEEEEEVEEGRFRSKARGRQKKKKAKSVSLAELEGSEMRKEDEEYMPSGNSDSEEFDEPEEELSSDGARPRKRKAPAKGSRVKALNSPVKRTMSLSRWASTASPTLSQLSNPVDDEDDLALQQALALSLGSSMGMGSIRTSEEMEGEPSSKTSGKQPGTKASQKRPNKKSKELIFKQSEIDAFFISIVGSMDGKLSLRHLENAATDQNFTWTEEELEDMIVMFDKDDDGQLNLAEFRSMAERCKLMDAC